MGAFADQIREFAAKAPRVANDVFVNSASALLGSIRDGSPVTGSPGQPVGQYGEGYHNGSVGGTLKASWQLEFPSPDEALVSTNVAWAPQNEYGISATDGAYIQRSTVGGRHSVELSTAGWVPLVAVEAEKVQGAGR